MIFNDHSMINDFFAFLHFDILSFEYRMSMNGIFVIVPYYDNPIRCGLEYRITVALLWGCEVDEYLMPIKERLRNVKVCSLFFLWFYSGSTIILVQ